MKPLSEMATGFFKCFSDERNLWPGEAFVTSRSQSAAPFYTLFLLSQTPESRYSAKSKSFRKCFGKNILIFFSKSLDTRQNSL
jgi:hypothetical protein